MSFLQPIMLAALPLVGLPILIHLINQRRYQTTRWAAMMFLLAAHRMSRGYARIRQWLILFVRMLAVAGLILAVGRPLASGWLGLAAGGRADTTIVLLDRSASMQQQDSSGGASKLETARRQLVHTLRTLGSSRWVLIESASNLPRELDSPERLLDLPSAEPTGAEADLPAMLEAARDYIEANRTGRTEIWICSDLRENDWRADSGRWQTVRESFRGMAQQVRFHLLAYADPAPGDVSVRVTAARRQQSGERAELLISLLLSREGDVADKVAIPLVLEIEGARSERTVEMVGPRYELKDYRIAMGDARQRGWGRIAVPGDANPGNNQCYFVFGKQPPRKAIIVADDPQAAWPLQLAASISPDPAVSCIAEVVAADQLARIPWEQTALILWQARLPKGSDARLLDSFVARGGQALFFPPRAPDDAELFGVRWQSWLDRGREVPVETWRGDQDLLAHALSGQALPLGDLRVNRYCTLSGDSTALAGLQGGAPLLSRVATDHGGVYFWATTPARSDSSLAGDAVALYVAVQRALDSGAAALGSTQDLVAGRPPAGLPKAWDRVVGDNQPLSTEYAFHPGVYTAGERLLAVHRPPAEDQSGILAEDRVDGLFRGLDYVRVDDRPGSLKSLVQEIWRLFLGAMIVALLCEAGLCLPNRRRREGAAS